jgi:hypothetical protein
MAERLELCQGKISFFEIIALAVLHNNRGSIIFIYALNSQHLVAIIEGRPVR